MGLFIGYYFHQYSLTMQYVFRSVPSKSRITQETDFFRRFTVDILNTKMKAFKQRLCCHWCQALWLGQLELEVCESLVASWTPSLYYLNLEWRTSHLNCLLQLILLCHPTMSMSPPVLSCLLFIMRCMHVDCTTFILHKAQGALLGLLGQLLVIRSFILEISEFLNQFSCMDRFDYTQRFCPLHAFISRSQTHIT